MPRKGNDLAHRFRKIGSRTPLYHDENQRFYWQHCWYCGIALVRDKAAKKQKHNHFTRDHVHPESHGGGKGVNTVPACYKCNQMKKALNLDEFRIIYFGGHGGLFYAEMREKELKDKLDKKEIRPTLAAQLANIFRPEEPAYKPSPVRCIIYRELLFQSPLTSILRRLLP